MKFHIDVYFELSCDYSDRFDIVNIVNRFPNINNVFVVEKEFVNHGAISVPPSRSSITGIASVILRTQVEDVRNYLISINKSRLEKFLIQKPKIFLSPAVQRIGITTGLIVAITILGHNFAITIYQMKHDEFDWFIIWMDIISAALAGAFAYALEFAFIYRELD